MADSAYGNDLDGYIAKFSPDMELLWNTYLFTRNSLADDYITSIASDGGNRLYFVGWVEPMSDPSLFDVNNILPLQQYNFITNNDYYQSLLNGFIPINIEHTDGFAGCFDSLKQENTAGINQTLLSHKLKLIVYPNPSSSILNVLIPTNISNGNVKIYNYMGQEVYSKSNCIEEKMVFDINTFGLGVYIVTVKEKNQCFHSKFVKQ